MVSDTGSAVVMLGPPGAGKTTVGAALAARLGLPFVDTDELVERLDGRPVSLILIDDGEQRFRELEREAVSTALAGPPAVVALGGGAVLDAGVRAALAGHTGVFLDVGLRDAARRTGFDTGVALMALNPRGQWLALMEARRPLYEAAAALRIDTSGRTADEVLEEVVAALDQAHKQDLDQAHEQASGGGSPQNREEQA